MLFLLMCILFLSAFVIFFAMIGYPLLLSLLDKILKPLPIKKDFEFEPTVSYMIVAHNEESVILKKLKNTLEIDYPKEKLQIIVASDNSTDGTNSIVKNFIERNSSYNIFLYCSKKHKGKTNAQNEAQKISNGEILVMTDANTMIKSDAIKELVACFTEPNIVYVSGRLIYSNKDDNATSNSESTYWDLDLRMRDVESRFWSITAGNGALYACRNSEYVDFDPITCHDSIMPFTYSKQGKRALFNPDAIAVEKAGENNNDEYKRKVRMNRDIIDMLFWGATVINPFRYHWFSLFYFGHRTCRYSLWLAHLLMVFSSFLLYYYGFFPGLIFAIMQIIFFSLAIFVLKYGTNNKLLHLVGYYGMTVFSQLHGVYNIIFGKAKPVWEKAKSTR